MTGIDFNFNLNFGQYTFMDLQKGLVNTHRTDRFLTIVRLPAQKDIRQVCTKISRKPSNKNFFILRSIKLQGKSTRWINWPPLFKTVEVIWRKLCELSRQKIDSLLLSSELKKLILSIDTYCSDTEINEISLEYNLSIEEFDKYFRENLVLFSNRLFLQSSQ